MCKKHFFVFCIAFIFLTYFLASCNNNQPLDASPSPIVSAMPSASQKIDDEASSPIKTIVFPDPALGLASEPKIPFASGDYSFLSGDFPYLDVSGTVVSYLQGNVTGSSHPQHILLLSTGELKNSNLRYYVVVLDYSLGQSIIVETIHYHSTIELQLYDVTGDGIAEILTTSSPNGYRVGILCEFHKFNGKSLECIYANVQIEENSLQRLNFPDRYFTGELQDNYELVIMCKEIGLSKKSSLLNMFAKDELEEFITVPEQSENGYSVYYPFVRYYKNGKAQANQEHVIYPYSGTLGDITFSIEDDTPIIEFHYWFYMGKWIDIAQNIAYLKYDEDTNQLKLFNAEINLFF